ncbi:PQQ-binding-like beta-propeller repeat protein [Streptomyces puniciscabiei]|uniref:outer membrane protein assembly factor BamB family protein n=1 Tax=Streptomyces puniciscabiei TaxID=164348 RepID=UPI003328B0A9
MGEDGRSDLPRGDRAALLALPFGAFATGLTVGSVLTFGDLSGRGPGWFALIGLFGTPFTLPLLILAMRNDRRFALIGLLAGGVLCAGLMYAVTGEDAPTVWSAAHDEPGSAKAVGSWQDGDLVVRVQPDRLTAYRLSDGTVAWRWTPPGRDVVCAMSRTTDEHTGLVGHAPEDGDCDKATALRLDSGKPLWTDPIAPWDDSAGEYSSRPDVVAVSHGTAVLPTRSGWRAVGLADGRERWSARADASCAPLLTSAGSAGTVVTVAYCGTDRAPVLHTYAAGTGRSGLRVRLPAHGAPDELLVLASDPLTVWVKESTIRGTQAVLSYDRTGRPITTIPLRTGTLELRATPSAGTLDSPAFAVRPARAAVVSGDTLITSGVRPGDKHVSSNHGGTTVSYDGRLVAYSLTSGDELWRAGTRSWVQDLTVHGDQVWALSGDQLAQIDPDTGHFTRDILLHSVAPETSSSPDLWVIGGGRTYAVVEEDGTDKQHPVGVARLR